MKSFLQLAGSFLVGAYAFADENAATLKEAFAADFRIGAAIGAGMTQPDNPVHALLLRQFNSITPTNLLKWAPYNPQPGVFNEEAAEAYFAFGQANGMYTVGHTLFWHQQTPPWVFLNESGGDASRTQLLQRMRERVRHVATLYGTRTASWDVVNEALQDDGNLRVSPYTRILGDDFLPEAFRIAQEELPATVAFLYNDYNLEAPAKIQAAIKWIKKMRGQGLRVDAVGDQAHWRLNSPTIAEIEATLLACKAANLKVHYTELDIEMLPRNVSGAEVTARAALTADNNPYPNGLPPALQEKMAQRYAEIFTLFHKYADVIDRVTFWGVTDADSWLNNWPVRGRTNYPLLFDRAGQPKAAFVAVIKAAAKHP